MKTHIVTVEFEVHHDGDAYGAAASVQSRLNSIELTNLKITNVRSLNEPMHPFKTMIRPKSGTKGCIPLEDMLVEFVLHGQVHSMYGFARCVDHVTEVVVVEITSGEIYPCREIRMWRMIRSVPETIVL